jgi:transcriptional regulator with XRE-family HTH domain
MSQSKEQAIEKGRLLKEFFKENGITQQDAADRLGILQTNVSALLLGKRNFGRKMAEKWSKAFGLRVNWLITGEGPMFEGESSIYSNDVIHQNITRNTATPSTPSELDDLVPIVPNGVTSISDSQPKVHQFPRYDFYFQCVTDAMRPEIYPGDLLGIRKLEPSAPLINGETYVFDTRSAGMQIRMLEEKEDGYLATAHNDRYKDTFFPRSEIISIFTIVGLVRVK